MSLSLSLPLPLLPFFSSLSFPFLSLILFAPLSPSPISIFLRPLAAHSSCHPLPVYPSGRFFSLLLRCSCPSALPHERGLSLYFHRRCRFPSLSLVFDSSCLFVISSQPSLLPRPFLVPLEPPQSGSSLRSLQSILISALCTVLPSTLPSFHSLPQKKYLPLWSASSIPLLFLVLFLSSLSRFLGYNLLFGAPSQPSLPRSYGRLSTCLGPLLSFDLPPL